MPWFKVDDTFPTHPKVLAIPRGTARLRCVGLWTSLGTWCASQLTDGHFATHMVTEHGGTKADAQRLVDVGLWETTTTGYLFHDWDDWQPTRAKVEKDRSDARERMRRNRHTSRDVRPNTNRTSPPVTPTPTRPDPTHAAAAAAPGDPPPPDRRLPVAIEILRTRLQRHTILAGLRFDQLTTDQITRLEDLVDIHGDDRLVKVAIDTCRTPPPVSVAAFIGTWAALPPPGRPLHAITTSDLCPEPGHTGTVRHCTQCASERKAAR